MKPAVTKHGPAASQSCLKTLAAPFRNGHACHARRGGRARERWEWRSCSSKAGNDCSLSIRNSLVLSRQVGRRGHNDHAPLANQNGLVSFGVSSRAAAEQCFFQRYAAQLCRCRNCHRLWLSCCRFVERRERGDWREPAGWPRSPHGGTGSCLPGRSRRRSGANAFITDYVDLTTASLARPRSNTDHPSGAFARKIRRARDGQAPVD